MAIAAKISSTEISAQVNARYVDKYFEVALVNSPATTYTPGTTNDTTFMSNEVSYGTGGYKRQVFKYVSGDVGGYADDGIGLATKAPVFTHDNSGTALTFSHAVLLRGQGNVMTLGAASAKPTAGINGTYTNLPTTTAGSGKNLIVNLTITNSGASLSDYALTIATAGYGYTASDSIIITQAVLLAAGAIASGAGQLTFSVGTASTGGGQVVSVAKTASTVNLSGGNQAVFYYNLKQFGYYTP